MSEMGRSIELLQLGEKGRRVMVEMRMSELSGFVNEERDKIFFNKIILIFLQLGSIYKKQLFIGCKIIWKPTLRWRKLFEVLLVK